MPSRKSFWVRIAMLMAMAPYLVSGARAQVNTATLSETVLDPQGLAVRGARVVVINALERNAATDDEGRYSLVGPAAYDARQFQFALKMSW